MTPREKRLKKLLDLPIIAMCTWKEFNPCKPRIGKMIFRSQVVRITKRSIVMRTVGGTGTVTLSSVPGWNVFDHVKIEHMPCDTTVWSKFEKYQKEGE